MKHPTPTLALILALMVVPAAAAQPTAAEQTSSAGLPSSEMPRTPRHRSYSFLVHLLVADTESDGFDGVSDNVRKTLRAMSHDLPFTGYRLLDFAWLRTSSYAKALVQGDARSFELTLRLSPYPTENPTEVFIANFDLVEAYQADPAPGTPSALRSRTLITTSFGMVVGETIVVGTAPFDSDGKSLVILMKAAATSIDN